MSSSPVAAPGPTNTEVLENVYIVFVSMILFGAIFVASLRIIRHYSETFRSLDTIAQADVASRVTSTVHAIIAVSGLQHCIWGNSWTREEIAFASPPECQTLFSISIGYFICDFFVVVYYKVDFWVIFVIHHVAAITPYFMNNCVPGCFNGNYVLATMMQVEFTNFFVNIRAVLDFWGKQNTTSYTINFYLMYILWIPTRLVLPIYVLYVIHDVLIPEWGLDECIVPGLVSAYVITFFCVAVFVVTLTPDVWKRWSSSSSSHHPSVPVEQLHSLTQQQYTKKKAVLITTNNPPHLSSSSSAGAIKHEDNCMSEYRAATTTTSSVNVVVDDDDKTGNGGGSGGGGEEEKNNSSGAVFTAVAGEHHVC